MVYATPACPAQRGANGSLGYGPKRLGGVGLIAAKFQPAQAVGGRLDRERAERGFGPQGDAGETLAVGALVIEKRAARRQQTGDRHRHRCEF